MAVDWIDPNKSSASKDDVFSKQDRLKIRKMKKGDSIKLSDDSITRIGKHADNMYSNQQVIELQWKVLHGQKHPTFFGKTILDNRSYPLLKLDTEWVYQNFKRHPNEEVREWFNTTVMNRKNNSRWQKVPAGNPSVGRIINNGKSNIDIPVLYNQGEKHYCVMGSLKACLGYIGDADGAALITEDIMRDCYLSQINNKKPLYYASQFMQQKLGYCPSKHVNIPLTFNPVDQCLNDNITVCVLINSLGGTQHAITIYRKMIFDSSKDYVMELSSESLNKCCEIENGNAEILALGCKYVGVHAMASFQISKKRKYRLLCDKKVLK